jgi:hypothetical protein
MMRGLRALRIFIVVTSIAAWFAASNHCAFGAPIAAGVAKVNEGMPSDCPMHRQHAPQPEKSSGCGDLPCCKNLQATAPMSARPVVKPSWLGALQPFFTFAIVAIESPALRQSVILDTGPPGQNNFTESVLQRSILAHAPPVSLS